MLLSAAGAGSLVSLFVPLIVFFLLMYFMIMRPQKKEQQRVKSMLASMEAVSYTHLDVYKRQGLLWEREPVF